MLLYKGKVIGIHNDENRELSTIGAMLAVRVDAEPHPVEGGGTPVLDKSAEVWRNDDRYNLFLFESEAQVRALTPDLRGLARLGDDQFICTAPGDTVDVVSRVFVPGAGVDEDSVTGSAHAVLTPFWAARLGRDRFTAHQASARGGDLICRLANESGRAQAWLGGDCVTVVEGTFYSSG